MPKRITVEIKTQEEAKEWTLRLGSTVLVGDKISYGVEVSER